MKVYRTLQNQPGLARAPDPRASARPARTASDAEMRAELVRRLAVLRARKASA
jgi:hypothetical protein